MASGSPPSLVFQKSGARSRGPGFLSWSLHFWQWLFSGFCGRVFCKGSIFSLLPAQNTGLGSKLPLILFLRRWIPADPDTPPSQVYFNKLISTAVNPTQSAVKQHGWIVTSLSVQELELHEEELSYLCNNLRSWKATIVIEPSLSPELKQEEPAELMGNCVILTPKRLNQLGFSTAQFVKGTYIFYGIVHRRSLD